MLKVAIMGKLPSKWQAPFYDDSWQIWGCNCHTDFDRLPKKDLWFDIHVNPPSYNIDNDKLITKDTYPLTEAINLVGGHYFNNSISYMIAYAILQGADEIGLWGVRLNSVEEDRTRQLESVRLLLFFAKGRGIKVSSYEKNILEELQYKLYGGFTQC